MTLPTDLFEAVAWSEGAQRWYWTAGSGHTGFVAEAAIEAELERHQLAMARTLETLTRDLYAGEMSVAEWETAVALELKNASLAQSMFAVGGADNMGASDYGRVGQTLREQYEFLDGFAKDIATENVTEGQAITRIDMYADATEQNYWDAWRANAEGGEGLEDLPLLETSPRDGDTQCLTHCRCYIRTNEDGSVDWVVVGDAESCDDCVALGEGGPYRVN